MKTLFRQWRGLTVACAIAAAPLFAPVAHAVVQVQSLGGGPNETSPNRSGFGNGPTLANAKFNNPHAVAIQTNGNLLIADRDNGKIRQVSNPGASDSVTTTFATKLAQPVGVAVDQHNFVYVVTQRDGKLRKYTTYGALVRTVSGLVSPTALALAADGTVFVTELGGAIKKLVPTNSAFTLVTTNPAAPVLKKPRGIAILANGILAVTESSGNSVRLVNPANGVNVLIAGGSGKGFQDGFGAIAKFNNPHGIVAAPNGALVVADRLNNRVRVIDTNFFVTTLYGIPQSQWSHVDGWLFPGWADGAGAADGEDGVASAREVVGLTITTNGTLYSTEGYWDLVRQGTGTGLGPITTIPTASTNDPAPTIVCSENITNRVAPGSLGSVVNYSVGSPQSNVVIQCFPPSGFNFAVGTTLVNCFASNTNQVTNTCGFFVSVVTNVPLPTPLFSPRSGYFPFGVTVTVTSASPVYYTTDATEPTTNSRSVLLTDSVGTLRFGENLRDLGSLRLKAIATNGQSATVGGTSVSQTEFGIPRDFHAGSGATILIPVVANLREDVRIQSFQYRVEITPLNGAPPVLPYLRAVSVLTNDFIPLATMAKKDKIAHFSYSAYSIGNTRGLVISASGTNANVDFEHFAATTLLAVPIDPNAVEGQSYRVQVLYPSATSDGFQSDVAVATGPARTITIRSLPWLVGDVAPGIGYNAGEFGDGNLVNSDANSVLFE